MSSCHLFSDFVVVRVCSGKFSTGLPISKSCEVTHLHLHMLYKAPWKYCLLQVSIYPLRLFLTWWRRKCRLHIWFQISDAKLCSTTLIDSPELGEFGEWDKNQRVKVGSCVPSYVHSAEAQTLVRISESGSGVRGSEQITQEKGEIRSDHRCPIWFLRMISSRTESWNVD